MLVEVADDGGPISPIAPQLLLLRKVAGFGVQHAQVHACDLLRHAKASDQLRVGQEQLVSLAFERLG
ncbi:hypothetical protein BSZ19_47020 [Bradyrhizobium japonicum]|uniref:Uncharacterized protein n=1 Tax=Bradyrhizobium japonicum TaxID=375 RepID=A0A1Y2JAY8_BRAJP|nr:hypothetical protein BSZ19_47020 [Bradyrhizobium japonicum]